LKTEPGVTKESGRGVKTANNHNYSHNHNRHRHQSVCQLISSFRNDAVILLHIALFLLLRWHSRLFTAHTNTSLHDNYHQLKDA
jgi:hypothetical protein